jgi:anti-anti-sigma regulatory factor
MLKITPMASKTGRCFVLEGRISGPWVGELQRLCQTALDANRRLTLDLTHVSFIDADGLALFRRLLRGNVRLKGGSSFVMEQLKNAR